MAEKPEAGSRSKVRLSSRSCSRETALDCEMGYEMDCENLVITGSSVVGGNQTS